MGRNNPDFKAELAKHTDGTPRLYHGTDAEFNPGDVILPANKINKMPSNRGDVAYATPDLHTAKLMAWEQNNHNCKNFDKNYGEHNPPPEHVYEVEPVNPKENLVTEPDVLSPIPNWQGQYGGHKSSPEVLSKEGFRVLSKVQHAREIRNAMSQIATDKAEKGKNVVRLLQKASVTENPNKPVSTEASDLLWNAGEKLRKQMRGN
jgi:hypothetical protein